MQCLLCTPGKFSLGSECLSDCHVACAASQQGQASASSFNYTGSTYTNYCYACVRIPLIYYCCICVRILVIYYCCICVCILLIHTASSILLIHMCPHTACGSCILLAYTTHTTSKCTIPIYTTHTTNIYVSSYSLRRRMLGRKRRAVLRLLGIS